MDGFSAGLHRQAVILITRTGDGRHLSTAGSVAFSIHEVLEDTRTMAGVSFPMRAQLELHFCKDGPLAGIRTAGTRIGNEKRLYDLQQAFIAIF